MPFTFFSHQAPVLPLKCWRPRWFCGTALAIGSMAPDLEYFLRGEHSRTVGHTLSGQVTFCLPVALALVWIILRVVAGPLGRHLPDLPPFHLRDYQVLARKRLDLRSWLTAALSALLGSLSHIGWDGFTHHGGWAVRHLPALQARFALGELRAPVWLLLQHAGTLFGGLFTLWLLSRIGRERLLLRWSGAQESSVQGPCTPRFWPGVGTGAAAAVAAALLLTAITQGLPSPWYQPLRWGPVAFKAVTFTFAALCIACLRTAQPETGRAEPTSATARAGSRASTPPLSGSDTGSG
ncbi:MAG TPA: DUF4184 family protein [Armatimonadota bacterium]|nr:DUF4184 family protein [Armatimonadota bacterium]